MGKKIPARKHRGVVDPEKQRQQRDAKLKNKINAPPSAEDGDQPVPKRLQELMRVRQLIKEGKYAVKKKKHRVKKKKGELNVEGQPLLNTRIIMGNLDQKQPGMKREEKVLPFIEQRPWEKGKSFLHRVHQMCDDVLKETNFEKTYKVQVQRNAETGKLESLKKMPKDEVDEMLKAEARKAREEKNPKRKSKKAKKEEEERAAAKEEKMKKKKDRWKLKREKLQQKAIAKAEEKGIVKHDIVKFGEVVHRPPELKVLPRKAVADKTVANLMWNQMLIKGKQDEDLKKKAPKASKDTKPAGKSILAGKRKALPAGQRRMLEEQQENVVAAYRLLKAKKEIK